MNTRFESAVGIALALWEEINIKLEKKIDKALMIT